MRVFLILSVTLLILSVSSAEEFTNYKIREENIKFFSYPGLRLTLSKPCKLAEKSKLCSNLDFLHTITLKKAGLDGTGGQNPSSIICKKLLDGKIYIGIDKDNNENSFCRLADGTYIDGGTLTYYAEKNQGVIQKPRNRDKYKK